MMNPLPVIRAELRRSPGAALAVVALIALAVGFGVAVTAQERALRQGSARAAADFDLLIGAPGSQTQLVLTAVFLQAAAVPLVPGEVLRDLASNREVEYAAPIAFGDRWNSFPVVGSTAAFVTNGGRRTLAEGRLFAQHEEVVVGADVPLALGAKFTPLHGAPEEARAGEPAHAHEGFELTVVGRLPRQGTPWDRAIVAPVEAVWEVHGLPFGRPEEEERLGPPWPGPVGGVPAIVVKPRSVAGAYRLRAQYRSGGTMALFPAEVLVELYATLGDARLVLSGVAIAAQALVVGAILLAVFALLALRRRPIAVLRALGASRGYVFATVWSLVVLLTSAGGLAGLGVGWVGAQLLSRALEARSGVVLPVTLGMPELILVLGLVAAGIVLAAIPAAASWRLRIADGLRQTG